MKKTFNILSIDFDFFQIVDAHTLITCYPDGLDLPSYITEITWASHYATNKNELYDVTVNLPMLNKLKTIIRNQDSNTRVYIAQSHKSIYDQIASLLESDYKTCNVYNIDMHHDCFTDSDKIDCGNWVNHILKNHKNTNITWIKNPVSLDVYGGVDLPTEDNFDNIKDLKFDLIFLCRSDSWTPPHLDKEFDKLLKVMHNHFDSMLVEESTSRPRSMEEINNIISLTQKAIKDMADH